jgi:RNA polymerase sigma factor (sigma-70 family)
LRCSTKPREASYRPKLRKLSKRELADLERRNTLVLAHLDWAHGIARQALRNLPTWFVLEDLLGPAEIGLIQAAERYDPQRNDNFRGYAQQRVWGACISAIRRREYRERAHYSIDTPRSDGDVPTDTPDPAPSPEEQANASQQQAIWQHVRRLPARHRLVIQRVYGDGHTLVEIAQAARVGESRLSQIHREALEMLRVMVGEGMRP